MFDVGFLMRDMGDMGDMGIMGGTRTSIND